MLNKTNLYFKKYIKYKNKYKNLVNQKGGECDNIEEIDMTGIDMITGPLFDDGIHPYNRITLRGQCYNTKGLYRWVLSNGGANAGLEHDDDRHLKEVSMDTCLTFPENRQVLTKEDFNDIPEPERYAKNEPNDPEEADVPQLIGPLLEYVKNKYGINQDKTDELHIELETLNTAITDLLNGAPMYDNIIPIIKTHVNNLIEHPKYIFLSDYVTEISRVEKMKKSIEQIMSHPAEQTIYKDKPVINIQTEIEIHKQHLKDIATQSDAVIEADKQIRKAQEAHAVLTATPKEVMTAEQNAKTQINRLGIFNKQLASIKILIEGHVQKTIGELDSLQGTVYEEALTSALKQAYDLGEKHSLLLQKIEEQQNIVNTANEELITARTNARKPDKTAIEEAHNDIKYADTTKTEAISDLKKIRNSVSYYK